MNELTEAEFYEWDRDRLVDEVAALRQQVADLTAERDQARSIAAVRTAHRDRLRDELLPTVQQTAAAQAEVIERVRALHPRLDNPTNGCCAPPKLCDGHPPICKGREHGLNRPTWPCPTIAALAPLDAATEEEPINAAMCGRTDPHGSHPMPCDSGCQPDWHRDSCAIYGTCSGLDAAAPTPPAEGAGANEDEGDPSPEC